MVITWAYLVSVIMYIKQFILNFSLNGSHWESQYTSDLQGMVVSYC